VVPVELFGLNKSPRLNFAGDADAAGVGAATAPAFAWARFPLGEAAGDAAGLAAGAASACLRARFAFGEAAGDAAGEDDVALSAAEAVVSAFLCARCFVGACSPGLGDWSCAIQVPTNPTTAMKAEIFVIIAASVERRGITVNPIRQYAAGGFSPVRRSYMKGRKPLYASSCA
jgi:hypothetical protein